MNLNKRQIREGWWKVKLEESQGELKYEQNGFYILEGRKFQMGQTEDIGKNVKLIKIRKICQNIEKDLQNFDICTTRSQDKKTWCKIKTKIVG